METDLPFRPAFQSLSVVLDAMEMLGLSFANPSSSQDALMIADIGSYPEVRTSLSIVSTTNDVGRFTVACT
jgi:hypothetical protein